MLTSSRSSSCESVVCPGVPRQELTSGPDPTQELSKAVSAPPHAAAAKPVPVEHKESGGDYGADVLKALMGGRKGSGRIIVKARGTLNPLGVGSMVSPPP